MNRRSEEAGPVEVPVRVPEGPARSADEQAFLNAAAAFQHAKPWTFVRDNQVIELRIPQLGWDRACVSVLGAGRESFGLALFRSIDDYLQLVRLEDLQAPSGAGAAAGVAVFSIGYEHAGHGEAAAHPFILKLSAESVPQRLVEDDYRLATAVLDAVRSFAASHRKLFRDPSSPAAQERLAIALASGPLEVVAAAPPAELPWLWGREEPREGLRRRHAKEIQQRFVEDRRAAGTPEGEVEGVSQRVAEAIRYRLERRESIVGWTADDVQEYLLAYYPAKGSTPDEDLELVPLSLDLFLDWLARTGEAPPSVLAAARERIARCREAYLQYARDPRRFSPAKVLVRAAKAEGVDLDDARAVDAFVKRFKRRLARDPSLFPAPEGALRRRAWVWTPGQPPPDPQGACPCGSGKRYRRCCMPR